MSNTVQGLVFNNAPYGYPKFNVLLALADEANDDGYCYISNPKLARKARVSLRETITSVQELERDVVGQSGETLLKVVRHNRKGLANDYYLNIGLLDALPFHWPEPLVKILGEDRVRRMHPKNRRSPVEKSGNKGARGGKNRVHVGCTETPELGARGAPLPCHVDSPINLPSTSLPVDIDRPTAVENFSEWEKPEGEQGALFDPVETARLLVQDVQGDQALPKGGRWVRDPGSDPGGWSSVEVLATYRDLVPRPASDADKRRLDEIAGFNFSTDLTIYLMQAARRKAKKDDPPNSMNYFLVAFTKLAVDIEHALRDADEATWGMSRQQAYWFKNAIVSREITLWERWLSRS